MSLRKHLGYILRSVIFCLVVEKKLKQWRLWPGKIHTHTHKQLFQALKSECLSVLSFQVKKKKSKYKFHLAKIYFKFIRIASFFRNTKASEYRITKNC